MLELTVLNVVLTVRPRVVIIPIDTTAIKATMIAYSIMVAPFSLKKEGDTFVCILLKMSFMISFLNWLLMQIEKANYLIIIKKINYKFTVFYASQIQV